MMNDITLYDMYMSIMIIFTAKAMVINRIVAFRFLIRETLKKASRFGEIPTSQESNG